MSEQINNSLSSNYIVGVGASAGGLEAINELFDSMPANTGFSFILVQHLSPDHKSLMGDLLSKHTEMQVMEAEEAMLVRPNSIYLIPTAKTMTLKNGKLRLEDKRRDHQPNNAIDIFFESLSADRGEKAVGIILSGTGTDGTKGIQSIKAKGGTVFIQDPATAQFDGMPNSAISSGYIDLILSPDMMAEELAEYLREAPFLKSFNALNNQEEAVLVDILDLVHKHTLHDFANYKRPTIHRRLARRMLEKGIKSLVDYYNYLQGHPDEIRKLCNEFLLHVTKFFRDEEAFDVLKGTVIPEIIAKKDPHEMVKIWSIACSTGEEPYSLAMLFAECLDSLGRTDTEIKIFATDISQTVIDTASKGLYTAEQVKNLSKERLDRFFVAESNQYRVSPQLRRMVVFARHDISKDPPFSKIDLVVCRNMLIYMNPLLQKNILQKVHFAVNEEGFVFLGPSENLGILKDVMSDVDKKWKIYRCISKTKVADLEAFSSPTDRTYQNLSNVAAKSKNALNNLTEIFKETLLEEYDYAGIFIDKDFEVKQAIGNFKKYMDFPEGNFNFNLLKLVPADLSIALSTGIRKAMKDNDRVVQRRVKVNDGKTQRSVTIIIKPYLIQKTYLQPFLFIILKEDEVQQKVFAAAVTPEVYSNERIEELEVELSNTKENLQALIEEVESSNEELQSSNEEIVSSNEELQSTNEELQSLNEELHTVNAEHQLKIKELVELNDDLNNYFRNTDIGQILIDKRLIIRKFTPIATKQVNLIASDIGRSIVDISTNMPDLNFVNDIKGVMQSGKVIEKEVQMEGEKTYLMRIAPYLRQNAVVDGVVVNFLDVSEVKKLNHFLQAVLNSSANGIVALKPVRDTAGGVEDFEIISYNREAIAMLGLTNGTDAPGATGSGSAIHGTGAPAAPKFSKVFDAFKPSLTAEFIKVIESSETVVFEDRNRQTGQWFEFIAVKMMDELVITISDITDRKSSSEKIEKGFADLKVASRELEVSNYKLQQSNFDLLQFASVASHDLKEPLRKIQVFGNMLKGKIAAKLDSSEVNYLDKMVNSSNRMQMLIDNILVLSRLSQQDTRHVEVDLNSVISQIIDDLEISIREKGVQMRIDSLPVIKGIPGQMHQLFQNLISNAIKFNQGHPEICIRKAEIPDDMLRELNISPDKYIAIDVKDNGIGFDERFSQKIFGVFQRLDPTHYEGTGIGLTIVKKIVDNHKGFIKAKSKKGEGALFTILLPQ
jgi:two-component system, chemotaxis family, CheB/CheR fusion protein